MEWAAAAAGMFGGGMNFDPDMIFDMVAKGADAIAISNAPPMLQPMLLQWAQNTGNTSGVISRDQFSQFMSLQMSQMQGGGFGGGFGGMGGGGGRGAGGGNADPIQMATQRFKKLDKDGDGYLSEDEMPPNVKAIYRQYDKNGDGLLDLQEYIPLFVDEIAKMGGGQGNFGMGAAMVVIEEEWDARPAVFRAGKLPKELPQWFKDYDKDGDGQVALFEWRERSDGRPIAEFQKMDRNGDGLLTAEEVLSYLKIQVASTGSLSDSMNFSMSRQSPGINNNPWQTGQKGQGPGGKKGGKGGPGGPGGGGKGGKGGKGGGKGGAGGFGGFGGNGGGDY